MRSRRTTSATRAPWSDSRRGSGAGRDAGSVGAAPCRFARLKVRQAVAALIPGDACVDWYARGRAPTHLRVGNPGWRGGRASIKSIPAGIPTLEGSELMPAGTTCCGSLQAMRGRTGSGVKSLFRDRPLSPLLDVRQEHGQQPDQRQEGAELVDRLDPGVVGDPPQRRGAETAQAEGEAEHHAG